LDEKDMYYAKRMAPPQGGEALPYPTCSLRNSGAGGWGSVVGVAAAAEKAFGIGRIKRECIARALQRSHVMKGATKLTFCESRTAHLRKEPERPPLCPTSNLVDFLHGWANRALGCLNSAFYSADEYRKLKINAEMIFAITNHESAWNMNATHRWGNGLMQLTTPPVEDFLNENPTTRKFWEMSKDEPACAPFRAPVDELIKRFPQFPSLSGKNTSQLPTNWQCSVTAPEAVPAHFIVALSNLFACQNYAQRDISKKFSLSRVKSMSQSKSPESSPEFEKIISDLVMVCHNWGVGNMQKAFLKISGLTFENAAAFRTALLKQGWSAGQG
jgi:hypothetical protein